MAEAAATGRPGGGLGGRLGGRLGRRVEPIEWAALVLALLPVLIAVVRAAATGWMPVGDAAYFTVRSRDVLTEHWPLLGAWSSGSAVIGVPVNNLGPLQLDVLAPFTKIAPYLGTAIGSALINGSAVALVWWAARRLFGPRRVVVVMVGTLVLMATLGLSWLIDARQQHALVLPFYALLWLSAAMWSGVGAAVPLGMAVGSLVVQTHFTYAYPAVIVVAGGGVAYLVGAIRHRRRWGPVAWWSGAVLAVCWAQPLIDQFFGTGNLARALGPARDGQPGAGLSAGVQVLAGGSLVPPFWLPGSIGLFLQPHDGVGLAGATVTVTLWGAAAVALTVAGWHRASAVATALGSATLVALGAALVGASLVPVSLFGLVPQNYYWVWPVGAFASIALLTGAWSVLAVAERPALRRARRAAPAALAAVLGAACLVASWPRYPVASVAFDEAEAERVGEPLRRELRRVLASPSFPATVEVDFTRAFFGNNFPFVLLTELQRAGIEFRFPAGTRNLDRFGESRCTEPGVLPRLFLIVGENPRLEPGTRVLARVDGISAVEVDEYEALQDHFGELLRDGTMAVDLVTVAAVLDDPIDAVVDVLDTPGEPATGLARRLQSWLRWGYVELPPSERGAFARWVELEERVVSDHQTVVLLPAGVSTKPERSDTATEAPATC